jgi:hypothetical protein
MTPVTLTITLADPSALSWERRNEMRMTLADCVRFELNPDDEDYCPPVGIDFVPEANRVRPA